MNKDGCYTSVHMHHPRNADLFEDVCKDSLPNGEIFVPPHHQPINPEDEDDVVPDQHAAFGIQKATQTVRVPAWKDLGLADLMHRGPATGSGAGGSAGTGRRGQYAGNTYAYYAYYYGYSGDTAAAASRKAAGGGRTPAEAARSQRGLPR